MRRPIPPLTSRRPTRGAEPDAGALAVSDRALPGLVTAARVADRHLDRHIVASTVTAPGLTSPTVGPGRECVPCRTAPTVRSDSREERLSSGREGPPEMKIIHCASSGLDRASRSWSSIPETSGIMRFETTTWKSVPTSSRSILARREDDDEHGRSACRRRDCLGGLDHAIATWRGREHDAEARAAARSILGRDRPVQPRDDVVTVWSPRSPRASQPCFRSENEAQNPRVRFSLRPIRTPMSRVPLASEVG